MSLDISSFNVIHDLAGRSQFLDWIGIFLAEYFGYFLALGFIIFFVRYCYSFNFFAFTALSLLLSWGLIVGFFRFFSSHLRPFLKLDFTPLINHPSTSSFPSGHATVFFTLAFILWLVDRRWGAWYLAAATLMGIARVFVGVHWPLDIVGGALAGLLGVLLIQCILPRPKPRVLVHAP